MEDLFRLVRQNLGGTQLHAWVNCNRFVLRSDYGVVVGGTVDVLVEVVVVDVVVVDASTTCMPYVRNAFTVKVARVL
jgi:hypothetical protein